MHLFYHILRQRGEKYYFCKKLCKSDLEKLGFLTALLFDPRPYTPGAMRVRCIGDAFYVLRFTFYVLGSFVKMF